MTLVLGESEVWKRLYHNHDNRSDYLEMILRFFALHYDVKSYHGNMNEFLNDFMLSNRNLSKISRSHFEKVFYRTMTTILEAIGDNAFYRKKGFINVLFESVSFTVSRHIDENITQEKVRGFYHTLYADDRLWQMTNSSTTSKRKLLTRLEFSEQIFSQSNP